MYFTLDKTLTTTPELIVDTAQVDRTVHVQEVIEHAFIQFNETGDAFGIEPDVYVTTFVLPSTIQLWAAASPSTGSARIQLMVTSVGR